MALGDPPPGYAKGLVPRDFAVQPHGGVQGVAAFSLPLIPQQEWVDRMKALAGQNLSDIRNKGMNGQPIPSRDQNGKGYCHTADTEVLTEHGWVGWPDYNYSDLLATVGGDGTMVFQAPFEKHVYEYDGEIVHSTNRRIDFGVTPDHRMLVRKWDERRRTLSDLYTMQRASDIGWYAGLMAAPRRHIGADISRVKIEGDREYDGDDFVALLALVSSDGFAGSSAGSRPGKGTKNLVSFACFRPDRREATAALAARIGFKEAPSRPGVWNRWDAGVLAEWMRVNCYTGNGLGAKNKRVPSIIKSLSARQIVHFLDFFGDRAYGDQEVYYSSSKRMIDDLQELCLRIGRRGTICDDPAKDTLMPNGKTCHSNAQFVLVVGATDRLCIDRKKHIETDHYKGLVYCAGVPHGTLITRRNGKVLISGNCWAHSGVSAMLLLRAKMNEPYADLSAYAVACIIKNYRDQGGNGIDGVEFTAQRGVPTAQFWPQQSMSRANDNPATWADAALHKDYVWQDIDPSNMRAQFITAMLLQIPTVFDSNPWGHSIAAMEMTQIGGMNALGQEMDVAERKALATSFVENHKRAFESTGRGRVLDQDEAEVWAGDKSRIWNSWGDGWKANGTGVMPDDTGMPAIPDNAVALVATSA